jgi:hypothetical protein
MGEYFGYLSRRSASRALRRVKTLAVNESFYGHVVLGRSEFNEGAIPVGMPKCQPLLDRSGPMPRHRDSCFAALALYTSLVDRDLWISAELPAAVAPVATPEQLGSDDVLADDAKLARSLAIHATKIASMYDVDENGGLAWGEEAESETQRYVQQEDVQKKKKKKKKKTTTA